MVKVDDGVYRGPEPSEATYQAMSALGIKTVIRLDGTSVAETQLAVPRGTRLYSFNLSTIFPPSRQELAVLVDFLSLPTLRPVYVHCKEGVDRTGMVIAAYRIANGWSRDRAIEEMLEHGFHWLWYFWWLNTLR